MIDLVKDLAQLLLARIINHPITLRIGSGKVLPLLLEPVVLLLSFVLDLFLG